MNCLNTSGIRLAAILFWLSVLVCLIGAIPMALRYWDTVLIIKVFFHHLLFLDKEYITATIGFYMAVVAFLFSYGYRVGMERLINWVKG